MIHVTQGHERGIGLEVFLKSFIKLRSGHDQFTLYANYQSVLNTAKTINCFIQRESDSLLINNNKIIFVDIDRCSLSESTSSLLKALDNIEDKKDILLTLPTSKDQLFNPKTKLLRHGYTEFLRDWFKCSDLTMCFLSPEHSVCLITDHIPLKEVVNKITNQVIIQKISYAFQTISRLREIRNVYIAGINPHCGEGGLLGTEDSIINSAVSKLSIKYPKLNFLGPLPGDTLHFHHQNRNDLLVYMYHDQGLAPFKFLNKLIGINLTCGLPFIRVSVDHGTSFDLYGKNAADPSGCLYLMEEILK